MPRPKKSAPRDSAASARPATRRATRRDVARAAGVSLTTVTHAFNPPPGIHVKESTVRHIRAVAQELGYCPSFVGRALSTGRTFMVGILYPTFSLRYDLYQSIIQGMVTVMEPENYHPMLLFRTDEARYLNVIHEGRIDGMFIIQSDLSTDHIARVVASGIPTVVVNKHIDVPPSGPVGCVHSDHDRLMDEVIDEFVAAGCKTIVELNGHGNNDANTRMFTAFGMAVARQAGAGVVGTTIIPQEQGLSDQLRKHFQAGHRWDGVFIDGPYMAEQFADVALEFGMQVGRDYRLITSSVIDGVTTSRRIEDSAYTHTPEVVGRAAWALMDRLIRGESVDRAQRLVLVPYKRHPVRVA